MDPYSSSRHSVPSANGNSDDRSSNSPSDDGTNGYPVTNDVIKAPDNDLDDDAIGSSLTSQTLNADGTPKRPMNAFMIFARRRRPQVSSENTSMRTGEISKILSREWNAMPPSEKQFYLDQAKQLKDTFNSKYPDYVYRRRPNNSRKRRRTEHSISHSSVPPGHSNGSIDPGDGLHGPDLGDSSPSEGGHGVHGHGHVDGPNSASYLRMPPLGPHDTSQKYGGSSGVHHGLQPRLPFSAQGNSSPFPDLGSSFRGPDHRLPFLPPSHEPHRSNTLPSPRSSHLNSILPPQSHFSSGNQWDSGRERSSWPTTTSDRSTTRTSFSSSSSATPPLTGNSWSPPPTASSATQGSASNSTSTSNDFPSFPTLNSPFYPSSGNHPPSSAPFSSSPSQSSSHLPPDSSSDRHSSYQSHHRNSYPSSSPRGSHSQSYQRGGDLPRALPSITSSFSNGSVSDPLADFGNWRPSSGHGLGH
ncbi:hypothetical protein E1B28_006075 [Marasmius oreades]|uniref:HMG box domain-containing protein n=1 Tax=Marasmius oreades TaxID=181124 RepID=A0A9P7S4U8_9AGAR|nr:uncharacterized protein E1B28_006075 [Marasmius oreades]KAG7095310.1 hypothetical protein E1B28_006075 [Marasmius oreades]